MTPTPSLYRALTSEWSAIGGGRAARQALGRWAGAAPSLACFRSPAEAVAFCGTARGAPANRVLAALIAVDEPLATRAVLQALLPGTAAMSRRARRKWPWMFDGRCDGPWVDFGFDHEAVAAAHARLRALAGSEVAWPATTVLDHVWRRARWLEEQHRRDHAAACANQWGAPVTGPLVEAASPDELDRRPMPEPASAAEELATLLAQATRLGLLPERAAALVYETRVAGRTMAEVARERGEDERLLRYHRRRAERRLVDGWAA